MPALLALAPGSAAAAAARLFAARCLGQRRHGGGAATAPSLAQQPHRACRCWGRNAPSRLRSSSPRASPSAGGASGRLPAHLHRTCIAKKALLTARASPLSVALLAPIYVEPHSWPRARALFLEGGARRSVHRAISSNPASSASMPAARRSTKATTPSRHLLSFSGRSPLR